MKPSAVARRQKFYEIMDGGASERLCSPLSASEKPRQALFWIMLHFCQVTQKVSGYLETLFFATGNNTI